MILFAIDPGVNGACCIFMDRKLIEVFDMPTMIDGKKKKRQFNGSQIYNEIFFAQKNFFLPGQKSASYVLGLQLCVGLFRLFG